MELNKLLQRKEMMMKKWGGRHADRASLLLMTFEPHFFLIEADSMPICMVNSGFIGK